MFDFLAKFLKRVGVTLVVEGSQKTLDLLKIKAVAGYLHAVEQMRQSAIGIITLFLAGLLMLAGFVGVHFGLFVLLDLSLETIAIVTLCLSAIYLIIGILLVGKVTSEKTWMELSGGDKLVKKVTEPQQRR
jgi:hypothetical protein